ncbi:hypothetical protein ACN47E_007175 [Coniothyrium glycines]
MADQALPTDKRTAPKSDTTINEVIAACNKKDRFKLLEDDDVLPADLDNSIHPVFNFVDADGPMQQMLLLASHFLTHDSLLVFFIPLLYGRELTSSIRGNNKTYLSDPAANVSATKKAEYLKGVREALHCLGHSIEFRNPLRTADCSPLFQKRYSCLIELAEYLGSFYSDPDGYAVASRCAQFRHDFLFATTLVHEIVHAVGVMKRGNLTEPHIRADCPETEWGFSWEHFMFGTIINPQDRTRPGTFLLMRKIWADHKAAAEAGGKEYCDVSMSYIAQWFRKETWDIIAEHGPTAIPLPTVHFKIQSSDQYGAWIVSSDDANLLPELKALQMQWHERSPPSSQSKAKIAKGQRYDRCAYARA